MKPGQTRVVVLLVVLFALEIVIHPGVKQWLQTGVSTLMQNLNAAANIGNTKVDTSASTFSGPGNTTIVGPTFGGTFPNGIFSPKQTKGPVTVKPGKGGTCPDGYININGTCTKLIPVAN